jgi:hypothetical protein
VTNWRISSFASWDIGEPPGLDMFDGRLGFLRRLRCCSAMSLPTVATDPVGGRRAVSAVGRDRGRACASGNVDPAGDGPRPCGRRRPRRGELV